MAWETLLITDDGPARTITLNRPQRRNAMTPQMQTELIQALQEAEAGACRVVVITGAGEAFCSGLDLSVLEQIGQQAPHQHLADATRIATLFRLLYELRKPTIAAVHGPAIAGGTGLATICDFTLATPSSRFGYTEVRIGFVPALVSAFLALQIGDKRSRDLLLTGRLFDAHEAHRLGLVNQIVEAETLQSSIRTLTDTLLRNSPSSLAATKQLMAAQNEAWLDAAITAAMEANALSRQTPDFSEGVSAFLAKRRPNWSTE